MADPRHYRVGDMVYVEDDCWGPWVVDWGPPNSRYLRQEGVDPPYFASSWKLLSVQIWYRFPRHARWYTGDHWSFCDYFWCKDWSQIPLLFDHYWATGGFYERVAFCVEAYDWTWEDGLMMEDHV